MSSASRSAQPAGAELAPSAGGAADRVTDAAPDSPASCRPSRGEPRAARGAAQVSPCTRKCAGLGLRYKSGLQSPGPSAAERALRSPAPAA